VAEHYLTLAEVIEMHRQLIEEFGGAHGVRDQGSLESAVYRPQTGYYNSLAEQASALMESLANNRLFIDGSKRICFAATDTFLRLNGFYLKAEFKPTHDFITERIAQGKFRFEVIHKWIASVIQPLPEAAD
jgi:death on curing protein